jgi:ankyrin repeat protein
MNSINKTEKQIFCADANMCAILAKRNSQNKWELWGLSGISEIGEAIYETRLFEKHEFDDVEPNNATSGHTHIKVLKDNIWSEIVFIEHKKATDKPMDVEWMSSFTKPPILKLSYGYEDENEGIESLVERGAGQNPTVIIDQLNAARCHYWRGYEQRLLRITDYFLKNGTDVNAKDEWGETALMAAASHYCTEITNLLLQNGAKVNEKSNFGGTAIYIACNQLNVDVVELLLENGAEVDSDCFLSIFDEWYLCAEDMQIQLELAILLLNRNINVNAKDSDEKTALMLIAESGVDRDSNDFKNELKKQIELIEFIIDRGADMNAQDNEGKTALMFAIEAKNKHLAEYLLEHGADANIKDNEGNTALTYAQNHGVGILGKLRKKMNLKKL